MTDIIECFIRNPALTKAEYLLLLQRSEEPGARERLTEEAVRIRRNYYQDDVYIRGLIEFTNYCKNDCYYCGIRRSCRETVRYRLTKEEILSCCEKGYELGFRTFVLQGGEDPYFNDERMTDIVRAIRENYPDCAITLSLGERSEESYRMLREAGADRYLLRHETASEKHYGRLHPKEMSLAHRKECLWQLKESYRMLREAGADRYLLRHETASEKHYGRLHPKEMSLAHRKECLWQLKELGYQVGAGFMVGSPGQTYGELAEDLVFLNSLQPQMVGIGPFLPHHATPFAAEKAGSAELTLRLLSIVRILLPKVLLPATTALGTLEPKGREKGLAAGANVVMPNLSPSGNRKNYELYDNKICTGEEAAEGLARLEKRIEKAGFRMNMERGDAKA